MATEKVPVERARPKERRRRRRSKGNGADQGPVAPAGHSAESSHLELGSGLDPYNVMPLKGSKLTAKQVGLLRAWIDQGMSWDAGVTFAKPALTA